MSVEKQNSLTEYKFMTVNLVINFHGDGKNAARADYQVIDVKSIYNEIVVNMTIFTFESIQFF
jgi:hypothetical protein